MSTCNRLDLQTLESQLIMPKNLPLTLMGGSPFSHSRGQIRVCGGEFRGVYKPHYKHVSNLALNFLFVKHYKKETQR